MVLAQAEAEDIIKLCFRAGQLDVSHHVLGSCFTLLGSPPNASYELVTVRMVYQHQYPSVLSKSYIFSAKECCMLNLPGIPGLLLNGLADSAGAVPHR